MGNLISVSILLARPLLLIIFLLATQAPAPDAMKSIRIDRLQQHVQFLASDRLEGRGTATKGYDAAANYVADQFKQIGLTPGGDQHSFFQQVPFRKADLVRKDCSFQVIREGKEENFEMEKDFLMYPDYGKTDTTAKAGVVFAGFGVTAPDLHYDDFKDLNAEGKIIAIFSGAPQKFPNSERAHFSSSLVKEQNAVKHGAVGILTIRNPEDEKRSLWSRSIRQSKLSAFRWMERDGQPNQIFSQIKGNATLSKEGAAKLLQGAQFELPALNQMYEARQVKSFELPVIVSMQKVSKHADAQSPNVVGILPGSDPKLKQDYVVYSAHLDHLGISEPVKGDSINNGAYDNGVGIAALIEIARAFALKPPRRSTVFLAVTGEEKGLQGSDYFAHYPTIPENSMVADINMDMFLMLYPFSDGIAFGSEHSSLGKIVEEAMRTAGLKLAPDPLPQEVVFIRSDQYPFIKKGIPSVMITSGLTSLDRSVNGMEVSDNWHKTIYHSPQDDLSQKMHWESGIKIVQASYLVGFRVANDDARPTWNQGDFFGKTFAGK